VNFEYESFGLGFTKLSRTLEVRIYKTKRAMQMASASLGGTRESKTTQAVTHYFPRHKPEIVVLLHKRRGKLLVDDVVHEASHVADLLLQGKKVKDKTEARAQLVEMVSAAILRKAA
jgi:hypothetical protein